MRRWISRASPVSSDPTRTRTGAFTSSARDVFRRFDPVYPGARSWWRDPGLPSATVELMTIVSQQHNPTTGSSGGRTPKCGLSPGLPSTSSRLSGFRFNAATSCLHLDLVVASVSAPGRSVPDVHSLIRGSSKRSGERPGDRASKIPLRARRCALWDARESPPGCSSASTARSVLAKRPCGRKLETFPVGEPSGRGPRRGRGLRSRRASGFALLRHRFLSRSTRARGVDEGLRGGRMNDGACDTGRAASGGDAVLRAGDAPLWFYRPGFATGRSRADVGGVGIANGLE